MQKLNFPAYTFRFKNSENKLAVFDEIRKKFVVLTPEEWVRQNVIHFLLHQKNYSKSYINVEKSIKINGLTKRYDVVVFQPDGKIFLLIECKAPEVNISQQTFDQIARYNMTLEAKYLMVTNGLNHYFCYMDYENEKYQFLRELPDFLIQEPNL
ncbi:MULTISPECIES: type I restriction enzyme HsdR N-terminal domain-containing protein [Flavobacterium]|uniref:type I restriction enzyme HsdR N-terminal domain-containing protein n=1 Tax=Flavobacterium TaxID=237 RepID=UPI001FCA59E9|nr:MULTISPECIES: type I restriction enzyme HsdR N-terminal domain-containing protein [Flavobacterium]UOK41834.1 type I restriction enzyme HsdR N-terminal domain-containing protein [Flavobacterium enshiense]